MPAREDRHQGIIRSKLRAPPLAGDVIERPRVRRELAAAADGRRILLVVASAGSGKTTAVVQFLASRPGPRAWLALGEADDSPGRLVTYLAASVEAVDAELAWLVRRFLADGLAPEDCAAILAEGLPPGTTLVIDDLHHVEGRAAVLRVLRSLLDALAQGALVVLASRRLLHLDLSREVLAGRVGAVSESELAFRADEIAELLVARGLSADAAAVEASSGGWAAGIVFEALRGQPGVQGPPPDDPFFSYLGSEVVDALPRDLRDVVVRSALLDVVTARRLEALLDVPAADAVFEAICSQRLPGSIDGEGLRYHPRFREFLLARLRRDEPDGLRVLMTRLARAFLADGHPEEAADHLLAAGERAEAEDVVQDAAPALMGRGDWEKVLGWCDALGEEAMARRPRLRGVQLRSLLMSRRQDDVAALVDAMRSTGELERHMRESPDVAAWAVWALHGSGDWPSLLSQAPGGGSSRRARVIRYILEVGTGREPPGEWAEGELDRPQPLHVALQSALYYRGRLADAERLAWAAAGRGPVTATLAEIYRIAVLRVRGDLAEARAALDATAPRIRASRFIEFWQQVEAELTFAEGDHDAGLRLIRAARRTSREHGYRVADRAVFPAIEGRMLVRMGRIPEAVEVLGMARAWCERRGLRCFAEWAGVWLAAALLRLGGQDARARELLSDAIAGMVGAGRALELPAAYVLLAEAEWRAGDEAAHDAAADAAHRASVAMGTLGPLLDALADAPDVLARRIDATGPDDETWRALARASPGSAARPSFEGARLLVRTLGRASVESGGEPLAASPPKAVELAAALARAGAAGAPRADLVTELFEGSADGANYLRQLLHRLRRALPDDLTVVSSEGRLSWLPADAVVTEDQVLESRIARARREVGATRLEALEAALELADRGPYLPEVDGEAARRRRDELAALVAEARREHARGLLGAGRGVPAAAAARAAVAADPYREDGWRLLMRCEAAARGPAAVLPAFLELTERLAEVGLEPSAESRHLLGRLRGERGTVTRR